MLGMSETAQASLQTQARPRGIAGVPRPLPHRRQRGDLKAHKSLRAEIVAACEEDMCHPDGLRGWLADMAQGTVSQQAIFAQLVARVVGPEPVNATQSVTINLGWLSGRAVAGSAHVTLEQPAPAPEAEDVTP